MDISGLLLAANNLEKNNIGIKSPIFQNVPSQRFDNRIDPCDSSNACA